MRKACPVCNCAFSTYDARQKTCSKPCADSSRALNARNQYVAEPVEAVTEKALLSASDLPNPEDLPAPYAKRVYDMWVALTGGSSSKRIA